jgi:hypothetical protein
MTLFPFWDSQEIFYAAILEMQRAGKPVKLLVLKARQLGSSELSEALIFHRTVFTEGITSLVVAQDPNQADFLFEKSRQAYDYLPWWMRPELRYDSKGRYFVFDRTDENMRKMHPGLRSQILVEAANRMTGVAVGKSIHAWHASELSLWQDPKILAEQIFPTLAETPQQIAIMESTARGRKGFWPDFWRSSWDGKNDWRPVFIEFFRIKRYSLAIPPSAKFERTIDEIALAAKVQESANFTLTDEQLYWRRKKMQEFADLNGGDESKWYQEYPASSWRECFQGSGICAFDKRKLVKMLETTCSQPKWYGEATLEHNSAGQPLPQIRLVERKQGDKAPPAEQYGSRLYVWEKPIEGLHYYVGVDVAHGVFGADFSCAQVFKIGYGPRPDEQVAEWHGWINPEPFGDACAALGYWYNSAELSIECNDVGISTQNRVNRQLGYPNQYRWKHFDKVKNFITEFLGWYTNSKTRPLIIAKFRRFMDENLVVIRSERLIDEALDFSREYDELRFEGQSGNDDTIMAAMIALFCAHDLGDLDHEREPVRTTRKDEADIVCICGHTKDKHGDGRLKGHCQEKDCPCQIWRQAVDFCNTEFSPMYDVARRPSWRDTPPEDYAMYEEMGASDEKWKTL